MRRPFASDDAASPAPVGAASERAVVEPRSRLDGRVLALAAVHLTALSSFAIAQPLFEVLGDNATFFTFRESTPLEIVALVVVVTLAPPAVLILVQAIAALIHPRARKAVHLISVGGLSSMIALQVTKRTELEQASVLGLAPESVLALAAWLTGTAAAVIYARSRSVQALLTVLGAAPVLFAVLFLFASPVRNLVFVPEEVRVPTVVASTDAPVVMVVFDELAVGALMDGKGDIDSVRYPNFARLARQSTWYRNTITVHPWTDRAVPAILTGNLPRSGRLPTLHDHPRNLFTLFADSHELRVFEWLTALCPARLCHRTSVSEIAPGLRPLLTDSTVVYLRVLLPERVADRAGIPPVTATWGDFVRGVGGQRSPSELFAGFLDSIRAAQGPRLYFLHVDLPHSPLRYLPSGRQYVGRLTHEVPIGNWPMDSWVVRQAHQRHLLQLGFVDRLLGRLFDRLRAAGLYEPSVIAITADHGVSFRPGDAGRSLTASNAHDIAFVPFFVKAPRQRSGRIVDRPLQTIDILPTIAYTLGVRLPWTIDGRSASAGVPRWRVEIERRSFDVRTLMSRRAETIAARIAAFGEREGWERVLRIGPHSGLLGRRVVDYPRRISPGLRAEIHDADLYAIVDRGSSFVPALVAGTIEGRGAAERLPLAVAVNGRIAAVTRTHRGKDGIEFRAVAPESAFRDGSNDVVIYAIRGRSARVALITLGRTLDSATFQLQEDREGELLLSDDGTRIRVREGAVAGGTNRVEVEADRATFTGWAADTTARRVRDRIVVFADGRFVASFAAPVQRPDLGEELEDAGFSFVLPLSVLTRRSRDPDVRVFGVVGGVASELEYPDDYPW